MRTLQSQAGWCARAQWVLGVGMLVLLVAFYFLAYRPAATRLADTRTQIESKQQELELNRAKTNGRAEIEHKVNDMRRRLERFDKQLPRTMEWGQFMNDITLLKEQSGVSNWSIEPTGTRAEDAFVTVPVSLSFEGDFLGVFSFLRQMEQMQRLTRVRDLALTARRDANSGAGQVDVKLAMNIYYTEK